MKYNRMIPENIHSLLLAAFRDSEHKRGFGSEYPEGLDGKVFVNQEQRRLATVSSTFLTATL